MARVVAISSWVARGHVGLSAILPVLQRLGIETIGLPTVVLSNHLGHRHWAGGTVAVEQLEAMVAALDGNGWLTAVDAVLTGYLPTPAHVVFAGHMAALIRRHNPEALVLCDPVLGDTPGGLYVPEDVALAVKSTLVAGATCITPNRFELEWLSGQPVPTMQHAVSAARQLGAAEILATSIPAGAGQLATICVAGGGAHAVVGPVLEGVPHGTGDVLAAMYLAERLHGLPPPDGLARAMGGLGAVIGASQDADELQLTASQLLWASPTPAALVAV